MSLGFKMATRFKLPFSFSLSIATRVLIMMLANWILIYTGIMPISSSYREIPLILVLLTGAFNIIQGIISVVGGYLIYAAIKRRSPSLIENKKVDICS
ncbi:MAG: hypothetical protein ACUVTB_03155 [Candidatus Bathycorpusculaceae bacterium]